MYALKNIPLVKYYFRHQSLYCCSNILYSIDIHGQPGGKVFIMLIGRLVLNDLNSFSKILGGIWESWNPSILFMDLRDILYIDSVGGLVLTNFDREASKRGVPLFFLNLSPKIQAIKDLINPLDFDKMPLIIPSGRGTFIEQIGKIGFIFKNDFYQLVSFFGGILAALMRVVRYPCQLRWLDVLSYVEEVGINGLPIVALISFLLGLIIAFMSSLQLQPFGANIYVANLVAVAMVKELGPIMTAILVAGRSGSAFAAEIGSMKVNEEIDALIIMGYDPVLFLVLPKFLATILALPLLTIFADLIAILGGLTVGVLNMGVTIQGYIQQTTKTIYIFDILTGILKAIFFAMLIASIGCERGFKVSSGPEAVGAATTSAVVSAIFLIILVDSLFAIVLSYIR